VKLDSETIEVAPEVPASQAKLTLVAILAASLGMALTLIAVGVWWHYQQRAAWDAQVQSLTATVQKNNIALADLRAQNASLAKHIKLLKEYSIARSTADGGQATPVERAAPAATASIASAPSAAPRTSAAGKTKKAKAQDCELVGKTPEQQAATLRRCVSQIDPPADPPRP
jgi:hypothetical protein